MVKNARTTELPTGSSSLAWSKLKEAYEPVTKQALISLTGEFHACALKNVKEDPEVWFNMLTDMKFRLVAISWRRCQKTTAVLLAVTPTLVTLKMVQDSIRQFWKTEKPKGTGGEEAFAFTKKFKGTCYNCV